MTIRLTSLRATFVRPVSNCVRSTVLGLALTAAAASAAVAAPGDAASAPEAASASYAAGGQIAVKPGQSLNDIAMAVTQSHDRATLARASRALFDANPNAFMSHDPSRLRLGSTLTVPPLDETGAPVASAASASAAASASTSSNAPAATATTGAASGAAQSNAAAANAANVTASAAPGSATQATVGAASAPAEANAAASAPAADSQAGAQANAQAGSQAAVPASAGHAWSGPVQAASDAAGGSATEATAQPQEKVSSLQQLLALKNRVLMELQKHGFGGSPAPTQNAASASGAQPAAGASTAAAQAGHGNSAASTQNNGGFSQTTLSVAAAIGAALVVLLAALRSRRRRRERLAAAQAANDPTSPLVPPETPLARDAMPSQESREVEDDEGAQHVSTFSDAGRRAVESEAAEHAAGHEHADAADEQLPAAERTHALEEEQLDAAGIVAEREAADRAMAGDADAAATETTRADHTEAEPAETQPETYLHATPETSDPEPLPTASHDSFGGVTTVASLAAAAELGADALPRTPLAEAPALEEPSHTPLAEAPALEEPSHTPLAEAPALEEPLHTPQAEASTPEATPRTLQWDDEPLSDALAEPPEPPALPIAATPGIAPPDGHDDAAAPLIDFGHEAHEPLEAFEPPAFAPLGLPPADELGEMSFDTHDDLRDADYDYDEPLAHPPVVPAGASAPNEIPRDALDAFGGLDMPLPPRVESTDDGLGVPPSLTTQPVASPESTARQAVAPHDASAAPHVADEIAAGTAGRAAVAGLGANAGSSLGGAGLGGGTLGAAGFGALNLDFDLELPPSPTQPIPAFTPSELSRIARNKLDLAAEYIELGDLSGARTLINEVIEANDPATRTEARALLSTLAPLS